MPAGSLVVDADPAGRLLCAVLGRGAVHAGTCRAQHERRTAAHRHGAASYDCRVPMSQLLLSDSRLA